MFRVLIGLSLIVCATAQACELGVYTYDSIVAKGGLGAVIFPQFEKRTGCKVRVIASGDAIQNLSRVEIDLKRGKPSADVILGVDALNWERARNLSDPDYRLPAPLTADLDPRISKTVSDLPGFVPYDFGALAFMFDISSAQSAPAALWICSSPNGKEISFSKTLAPLHLGFSSFSSREKSWVMGFANSGVRFVRSGWQCLRDGMRRMGCF